jgi:hypothetical protein
MWETLKKFFTVESYFNGAVRVFLTACAVAYVDGRLTFIPPAYDWAAYIVFILTAWGTGNGNKMDERIKKALNKAMGK